MKELIDILDITINEYLGNTSKFNFSIEVKNTDSRIHITFISDKFRYSIYTIITDNEFVILDGFKFKSSEFFSELSKGIVSNQIIPFLKMNYLRGLIDSLPERIMSKEKPVMSIDLEWLKNTFHKVSEEEGNSEMIENIKMSNDKDKINITFDVDCGRYGLHRENRVEINDRGYVSVYLSGPLDGSGIETELANKIRYKINNN